METREEIGKWYDDFAKHQVRTSVNLRHYRIMEFLKGAGLKRDSKILEIGCGIGTLTGLLLKYVKKGKVVAADISPESVTIAKERLSGMPNISFLVTDMTDFHYPEDFDFIVLPDVLEHIPVRRHMSLFHTLASHMHDSSVILIHIPHPQALDYIRENSPDKLQIIDQSVSADTLLKNAYNAGLVLVSYISYPLFNRTNDYVVITFRKKGSVNMSQLPRSHIIYRKFISRIRFLIARI
jgi:trans-aconitate 2-methyltransferase